MKNMQKFITEIVNDFRSIRKISLNKKNKAKVFVLEGSDGAGKQTQSTLLHNYLKEKGENVHLFSFPNYKSTSSTLAKEYLKGTFGENANDVNPYVASSTYAIDRYLTFKEEIEEIYNQKDAIIIFDRYTTSNMLHQAAKIEDIEEREELLDWLYLLEFITYGLPIPTQVFYLTVQPEISEKLIKSREVKSVEKDIHEKDVSLFWDAYYCSRHLISKYGWEEIECVKDDQLRSIEEIQKEIIKKVTPLLNK